MKLSKDTGKNTVHVPKGLLIQCLHDIIHNKTFFLIFYSSDDYLKWALTLPFYSIILPLKNEEFEDCLKQ